MAQERSNRNEAGVRSIRIGGMRVDDLPIAEAALTKEQLPEALETERQNMIGVVRAGFPDQSVAYLKGRIEECLRNLKKFRQERGNIEAQVQQYSGLLALCKLRDKEMGKLEEDDPEFKQKVNALRDQFGFYQTQAMEKQMIQFEESIGRFDDAVGLEQESLKTLRKTITLCEVRDKELAKLGA